MSKYQPWKAFESQIVAEFKKMGWLQAKRNWSDQFGKKSGKDILNTEPYVVQLKYGKRPDLVGAYEEAEKEANPQEIPVGIVRTIGKKRTLVCLNLKDFKWLILCGEVSKKN